MYDDGTLMIHTGKRVCEILFRSLANVMLGLYVTELYCRIEWNWLGRGTRFSRDDNAMLPALTPIVMVGSGLRVPEMIA